MNILTINIGNTHTAFTCFKEKHLLKRRVLKTQDLSAALIAKTLSNYAGSLEIEAILMCSVMPRAQQLVRTQIKKRGFDDRLFVAGHNLPIPMRTRYHQHARLGKDRIVGAYQAFWWLQRSVIVVDAGTAVTIDAVSSKGVLLGGVIAPGPTMMLEALSSKTAQIPAIHLTGRPPKGPFGRSTRECALIGATTGLAGLIGFVIERMFWSMESTPAIICTGGFAPRLGRLLKKRLIVEPLLIERGLIRLYLSMDRRV